MFCALALAVPIARAETRVFTMKNTGKKIPGELKEVEPGGNVIVMSSGDLRTVDPKDFSNEDREYFRAWLRENRGIYDWPAFRGRWTDGSTDEKVVVDEPTVSWRAKVGAGDAAVMVGGDRACTVGVRDDKVYITVLRAGDGHEMWQKSHQSMLPGSRATATPLIDLNEDRLITVGPDGRMDCWNLENGDNVWAMLLPDRYRGSELPLDGVFGSPVMAGGRIIMEVGGPACSLVALTVSNGLEDWRIGKHRSLGAPVALAQLAGRESIVQRTQYGIIGRDARAGTMVWDHAWPAGGRAGPLVIGDDRVFVTSEKKCAMIKVKGRATEQIWESDVLCSKLATPVTHGGHLYGFNGGELTCVDAESGKVTWKVEGFGGGNLTRAADKLLIQTKGSGELVIADADPAVFRELSRTKVFEGESNTSPVLASGWIYCRSAAGDLTCVSVAAKK